LHETLSDAYS